MRILYFGTYISDYSRNSIMITALRSAGVDVVECNVPLWKGIDDRVQAVKGGWKHPLFWLRVIGVYFQLLWKYLKTNPHYDILIIGYPGQFDVFLGWLLARLKGKPLVWDVFMSIFLIASERGLDQKNRFITNLIRRIEKVGLQLPDLLIQDTSQYVEWHHATHGINPERFALVSTGANDHIFFPLKDNDKSLNSDDFCVTYYGSFIPNHGLPYLMKAVQMLQDHSEIRFEFIGDGPDLTYCMIFVQSNQIKNVTFLPWMKKNELVNRLRKSAVILGAFGNTPQSLMTIQNKIFEGLALAKPVISGDSPAIRQTLTHGTHVWLCKRDDPYDLAQAIITLKNNLYLREKLGRNGYQLFITRYSIKELGKTFKSHLDEMLEV